MRSEAIKWIVREPIELNSRQRVLLSQLTRRGCFLRSVKLNGFLSHYMVDRWDVVTPISRDLAHGLIGFLTLFRESKTKYALIADYSYWKSA